MGSDAEQARRLVRDAIKSQGANRAELSRLIGRADSYVQQYITKGSPLYLDERARPIIAQHLGLAEEDIAPKPIAPGERPAARAPKRPQSSAHDGADLKVIEALIEAAFERHRAGIRLAPDEWARHIILAYQKSGQQSAPAKILDELLSAGSGSTGSARERAS